jgi:hypothetical protein
LDGTWFRAFDFDRWDYWGSNADAGWGVWCVETGWVQGWIVTVLSLRQLDTTLWDLATERPLGDHLEKNLQQLLPADELKACEPAHPHAAIDRPITLANKPNHGPDVQVLVDGAQSDDAKTGRWWLTFHDADLDVTVDLGEPIKIQTVAGHFLQQTKIGIFLPKQIEIAVSDDGRSFRTAATVTPKTSKDEPGPLVETIGADKLDLVARYARVRAGKVGPPGRGWLFVDEILVNPKK